jgi:tRNA pseudouridine13 synthase
MNLQEKREYQQLNIERAKIIHPDLFTERTFEDDDLVLNNIGIHIPDKAIQPKCYLKLWPQDFIVEEMDDTGKLHTIDMGDMGTAEVQTEDTPTTYATLVKCGISTIEAVEELASLLACDTKKIGYAGIKDKDAITAQRISIRHVPFDRIRSVSSPHFFLKDILFGKGIVEIGKLQSNRFTILLRANNGDIDDRVAVEMSTSIEKLRLNGFFNYYYIQRFGTPRLLNFKWAYLILQGKYDEAVRSILTTSSVRESRFFVSLRKDIEPLFGDWKQIEDRLLPFPLVFKHELILLAHLRDNPTDFLGALGEVSDQVGMWVYAFSSWLFNEVLSGYQLRGETPPTELPLFLSPKKSDWDVYQKLLESVKFYPPDFRSIRPFPRIRTMTRLVPTLQSVDVHTVRYFTDGIALQFSLGKGSYATTFLSHIVTLLSGSPPMQLNSDRVDTKASITDSPSTETVNYFEPVIYSKFNEVGDDRSAGIE